MVSGQLLDLAKAKDWTAYVALRDSKVKPAATAFNAALTELVKDESAAAAGEVRAAERNVTTARAWVIGLLAAGCVLSLLLAWIVAMAIVRPVRRVVRVAEGLARGDLRQTSDVTSADEVGKMAQSLDRATGSLRNTVGDITRHAQTLAGSSEELSSVSQQIASSAEETATQAGVVSAASEQVSRSVQTVASGAEQMGASIREIAASAAHAAQVAAEAVTSAADANTTVTRLGQSSNEIGSVVKLIKSIAQQTNLLALNATIEAARAGEAGKGFAVVASEVKDLAQETAKATEEISERVHGIQLDSVGAVEAITRISQVIEQISDYSTSIASAVEQQSATSADMARSLADAAAGAEDIAGNIVGVATAAQLTTSSVTDSSQAALELARLSSELQRLVNQFTV